MSYVPGFDIVEGNAVDPHPEAQGGPRSERLPQKMVEGNRASRRGGAEDYTFRSGPRPEFDKVKAPNRGAIAETDIYLELPADVPFPPRGADNDGAHSDEQQMHYWLVCARGMQFFPENVRMGS